MSADTDRVVVVALTERERRYLLERLEDVDEPRAGDLRAMLENALEPSEARVLDGGRGRVDDGDRGSVSHQPSPSTSSDLSETRVPF